MFKTFIIVPSINNKTLLRLKEQLLSKKFSKEDKKENIITEQFLRVQDYIKSIFLILK